MEIPDGHLDLTIITNLKREAEAHGDWTQFAERLATVFGQQEYNNSSFLQTCNQLKETCPVDKMQAKEAFKIILESSIFIQDQETSLLPDICEFIAALDPTRQDILCRYLIEPELPSNTMLIDLTRDHYVSCFKKTLQLFQQLVCRRLLSRTSLSGFSPNSDPVVIDATKCIAVLYRLNEKKKYVSYVDFYNDAVNEQLEIKEDFPNFKDRKGFSFCDYPFMLNPAVKADVLKVESVFQMRHELQDAFFRALFQGVNSPYLVLEIRRDHIISDTLIQLEEKSIHDLKKQLRVQFLGEEGVDEGGVQKEFFQLIVREIFDTKYGMFTFNEESRLCWFSPNPVLDNINIREYKLVGLLLGLAVYNSVILDLHFPLALYKKLMDVDISLSDLKQLDPSLGKGLERLLSFNGDIESEYDRSFQVDIQSFGHVLTCDLKPDGAKTQLTSENSAEFVDLYARFVLSKSVEKQFNAFREGFQLVCQDSAIKIFRPEEVEQLICGSSDLDFDALEQSTVYDGGWTKDSDIIKYFWEIVHSFTYEEKKKLLFFATGSDRAPIGGLSKLQFVIAKNGGDSDRLPTSHTCYNVLLLCEYSSKEKLKERLLTSISNAEGFGMI
ncbi:hypothetical protein INT48_006300 [Thamnidium elegans]|uniref:HECT-type E3 ubiquitin transferase n=1 Tax=Thamnidium elegans TaxID=101142 RepID=A0A8H7SQZ9_9FUNG|nr:hypothetical protein INT48_006300 [Thamnidium elegans]